MIKIELENGDVKFLNFRYEGNPNSNSKRERVLTTAILRSEGNQSFVGATVRYNRRADRYSKDIGRQFAIQRLMDSIDMNSELRQKIWVKYFETVRSKGPAVGMVSPTSGA